MEYMNVLAAVLLLLAVALCLKSLLTQDKRMEAAAFWSVRTAFICLTLALIMRGVALGRLPLATVYEFTFLFAWGILLYFIVMCRNVRSSLLTLQVASLVILVIIYGSFLPPTAKPPMPALQSYWLHFHVLTAIAAYGAFGLACCIAIVYLLIEKVPFTGTCNSFSALDQLDRLIHRLVRGGFFLMTLVLITGAVWAEEAWGSWWSWDPKETWALVTWLIYAGYLHSRKTYGWQGKKGVLLAIIGFMAVLITLFGVSLFLPGTHSYM